MSFAPGFDARRHELTPDERQRAAEARQEQARRLREARAAMDGLPLPERREVTDRARAVALEAVDYLAAVLRDGKAPHFARLAAARELLDRAGFQVPRYLRVQAEPDIAAAAEALQRDRLSPETEAKLAAAWQGVAADLAAGGRGSGELVALPALPEGEAGQRRA